MSDTERVGITPKSWTAERQYGVLHFVVTADLDDAGTASGVRLDGLYANRLIAETAIEEQRGQS